MTGFLKKIEASHGIKLESVREEISYKPATTLAESMEGMNEPIEEIKSGFLRVGTFNLRGLSAKQMHDLAHERNKDVFKLAKEYAWLIGGKDNWFTATTHYVKDKIKVHRLEDTLEDGDDATDHASELFYEYGVEKASTDGCRYKYNSYVNLRFIPTLRTYKKVYCRQTIEGFSYGKATEEHYEQWKNFIISNDIQSANFLKQDFDAFIDLKLFKRHAYIIGATGSGKTEFLKVVAHHVINEATQYPEKKISGLMIDPHGDFAEEVVRFKECYKNDNIIYFDPKLYPDKTPCIDIFSPRDYEEDTIEIEADNLVNAFQEIIGDASLSAQMETLLKPCIAVLLRREHSTLHDLQRFMVGDDNKDLIELGKNAPNRAHSEFFKNGFHQKNFDTTKRGIYTRIQTLLNSDIFNRLISPHATLDIEKALEDGKFIIMSLSRGGIGADVSSAFGRLVLAKIKNAGFRRANIPKNQRANSYIFIDECQNYVGESIEQTLTELRKYGIYMILANQVIGQEMSQQLKNIILSNTAVKIVGSNANKTLSVMATETGAKLEDLEQLTVGRFCGKVKHDKLITKPFYFTSPTDFLGNKNCMASEQWKEQKKKGWSCYVDNNVINETTDISTKPHSISIDETVSTGDDKPAFKL